MSGDDNKKDMTRIEDLGEFLHDPNEEGLGDLEDLSTSSSAVDLNDLDSEAPVAEEALASDIPSGPDEDFVIDLSSESTGAEIEETSSESQIDLDDPADSASDFTATEEVTETTQEPFSMDLGESSDSDATATENFIPASDDNLSLDLDSSETPATDELNEQTFEESPNEFSEDFNSEVAEPTTDQSAFAPEFEEPAGELLTEDESAQEIDSEVLEQNLQAAGSTGPAAHSSMPAFEDDTLEETQASPPQSDSSPASNKPRENFEDIRKFGEAITYGEVKAGGNPAYALIIKNIRSKKDKEIIFEVLEEHKMTLGEMASVIKTGLDQGALLLSQLSEYSAIYLAHRLRLLDIDIQFGLSEKMHLSKNYQSTERGLVSQNFITQSKAMEVNLAKNQFRPEDMITATVPVLPGKKVLHYFNIISAYKNIKLSEFGAKKNQSPDKNFQTQKKSTTPWYGPGIEPDEHFEAAGELDFQEYFDELTEELRLKAYKLGANAVIAISFQLTPLSHGTGATGTQYRLVAIGNAVYLVNNEDWEANV